MENSIKIVKIIIKSLREIFIDASLMLVLYPFGIFFFLFYFFRKKPVLASAVRLYIFITIFMILMSFLFASPFGWMNIIYNFYFLCFCYVLGTKLSEIILWIYNIYSVITLIKKARALYPDLLNSEVLNFPQTLKWCLEFRKYVIRSNLSFFSPSYMSHPLLDLLSNYYFVSSELNNLLNDKYLLPKRKREIIQTEIIEKLKEYQNAIFHYEEVVSFASFLKKGIACPVFKLEILSYNLMSTELKQALQELKSSLGEDLIAQEAFSGIVFLKEKKPNGVEIIEWDMWKKWLSTKNVHPSLKKFIYGEKGEYEIIYPRKVNIKELLEQKSECIKTEEVLQLLFCFLKDPIAFLETCYKENKWNNFLDMLDCYRSVESKADSKIIHKGMVEAIQEVIKAFLASKGKKDIIIKKLLPRKAIEVLDGNLAYEANAENSENLKANPSLKSF